VNPAGCENFYDELAADYDAMTRFEERLASEKPIWRRIVEEKRIRRALDVGCGTGLQAILLASLGVTVTALDPSRPMIERARSNGARYGVQVQWLVGDFRDVAQLEKQSYDLVFSIGNTLPHIRSIPQLEEAFQAVWKVLRPGGWLLLQLLNYHRILAKGERLIDVRRIGDRIFLRFYDFLSPNLRFNILKLSLRSGSLEPQWFSTEIRPWTSREIQQILQTLGFCEVEQQADFMGAPFEPDISKNLVLWIRKTFQ